MNHMLIQIAQIDLHELWKSGDLGIAVRLVALTLAILPLSFVLSSVFGRFVKKHFSEQWGMLTRKGIHYTAVLIVAIMAMNELGFKLTALLGAAGVLGVAIGFASQTSFSNIISGLFLISEKHFAVGDVIQVGATVGTVMSIDLLSVKVRTFDNKLIRLPNETLIKTELTNVTGFPIRRHDMTLNFSLDEDPERIAKLLKEIAADNPFALDEPEPIILFTEFGEYSQRFLFAVWFAKADFLKLRQTLMPELKKRLTTEGIKIAQPTRVLIAGSDPLGIPAAESSSPY